MVWGGEGPKVGISFWSFRHLTLWGGVLATGRAEKGPLTLGHKAGRPWALESKGDSLCVCQAREAWGLPV